MYKMKNSGIDWIGKIPENWEVKKIKYLATDKESLFMDGNWIESKDISDTGIRYLTTGNVGVGIFKEQGDGFISETTFKELNCLEVLPGDLMISRLNLPIGRACIIPETYDIYVVAVDNVILRPDKEYFKQYLLYVMNTEEYADEAELIARGTTMQRISRTQLANIKIPIPTTLEQKAIAEFLDLEVEKTNKLISNIENQIEVLEEYKKSLITETVTKGLDRNIHYKETGFEWLGKTPAHWELKRLKDLAYINTNTLSESTHQDFEFEYIDISSVDYVHGIRETETYKFGVAPSRARRRVNKGDTLISTVRTYLKAIAYVDLDGDYIASTGFAVLTPKKNVNKRYLFYLVCSEISLQQIEKYSYGVAYPSINFDLLSKIRLSLPPMNEQDKIVEFLDGKVAIIDSIIKNKHKQLEVLLDSKNSLIYEYVTGKKRVGGFNSGD